MGITGHDDDITDYSPDGVAARAEAARSALRELDGVGPDDDVDSVTIAAMRDRLGVLIELHDAGLDVGDLNVIASPLQTMRDVFDLMPTDTDDDWAVISRRLSRLPDRAAGYARALRAAVAAGHPPAVRQVTRGVDQAAQIQQLFIDMVAGAAPGNPTTCAPNCRSARHRPQMPTANSPTCCATTSRRTPEAPTHSGATPTGCSRGRSWAQQWIWTRPISGACSN